LRRLEHLGLYIQSSVSALGQKGRNLRWRLAASDRVNVRKQDETDRHTDTTPDRCFILSTLTAMDAAMPHTILVQC